MKLFQTIQKEVQGGMKAFRGHQNAGSVHDDGHDSLQATQIDVLGGNESFVWTSGCGSVHDNGDGSL